MWRFRQTRIASSSPTMALKEDLRATCHSRDPFSKYQLLRFNLETTFVTRCRKARKRDFQRGPLTDYNQADNARGRINF
jgi:hypothetical protein